MAGNITKLSLTELKRKINDYENASEKLYRNYDDVHDGVEKLRKYWTGNRINMFITTFNTANKTMFAGIQFFTDTVYNVLDEVYVQYCKMEKGTPKNVSRSQGQGIENNIGLTDANTIKFTDSKVKSLSNDIQTKLTKVRTNVKSLVNQLDSLSAYSDSLKTIVTKYKATAENLDKTLNKLKVELSNALEKAVKDVQTTESYNESDAKKIK